MSGQSIGPAGTLLPPQARLPVVEENVASARVLEKCGFTRVGTSVERWQNHPEPVQLGIFSRSRG